MRYRWQAVFLGIWLMGASAPGGVQVESGKLTVHVRGVSLREVLGAITAQGGVSFRTISGGPVPDGSVTEEFTGLTMEQGIARLLGRWDYALVKEEGTDRLKEVYIFATGSGSDSAEEKSGGSMMSGTAKGEEAGKGPMSGPGDEEIQKAIEAVKKAPNADEEAKAMLNLQNFRDEQTLEQVLRPALLAVSPKVRMAALEAMYIRQVRDPDILEEIRLVSIRDPDPAVREKAQYIAKRVVPDIVHEGDSTAFWMNP